MDKLYKYIMKPLTNTQTTIWLKANNIILEKTDLFYDFVFSLLGLVNTTYLGEDVTPLELDKINHFNWCWNRTIESFEKERIHFDKSGTHYDYFWAFFRDAFYYQEDKEEIIKIDEFFKTIFDLKTKKTRSELDMLGDLYKTLDRSLKKLY